jgi:predicted  nucleic acid-binding Zn-ribbon protein
VAALADNGQAQEPLGSLLVKRGLITPEQLEVALQEQKTTGEPLGAIVVARGFAAPATVAQALATQHGGLLKTEYGFATGFSSGGLQTPGAVGEPPVSSPRLGRAGAVVSIAEAKPKADPVVADREAVREELSMASAETEKLSEANDRLVAARAELEQRLAQESQRAASLENELATLRSGNEDLTKWQDAVAQWQAAYGELEQRLTDRDTELAELRASIEACDTARTDLERGLAAEVERSESLKQELALVEGRRADAESADSERVALEEKLAEVTARAEALEAEAASARELGESASNGVRAELEAKLAEADEQLKAAEAVRGELEQRVAEATERAGDLAKQAEEAEALRRSALASEQAIGELERKVADAAGELAERNAQLDLVTAELEELRNAPSIPVGPWADAQKHLLFFQGPDGYELVERDGPPPAEGASVDGHVVSRISRSPMPGSDLPCAYLVLN